MRILAVVVAYRPNVASLCQNLALFSDEVEEILLWKNSPFEIDYPKLVDYCGADETLTNCGISYALNRAWKYAEEHGYDHLLIMDQDSRWENFSAYLHKIQTLPQGIYGPLVNGAQMFEDYQACDFLINSGMLVSLDLVRRIGGWCEDLFVDAVDVEFLLHAKMLGIPSYRVNAGMLWQQFGKRRKTSMGFYVYDYSPERLYEIFKNHIIVIRKYGHHARNLKNMFIRRWVLSRIPRIVLGEHNRVKKIKAILKAVRDGFAATVTKPDKSS